MQRFVQRRAITGYAYKVAKSMMPKISGDIDWTSTVFVVVNNLNIFSDTERAALNAGTVGFDRNIFQGDPSLADLKKYSATTSIEEQGICID